MLPRRVTDLSLHEPPEQRQGHLPITRGGSGRAPRENATAANALSGETSDTSTRLNPVGFPPPQPGLRAGFALEMGGKTKSANVVGARSPAYKLTALGLLDVQRLLHKRTRFSSRRRGDQSLSRGSRARRERRGSKPFKERREGETNKRRLGLFTVMRSARLPLRFGIPDDRASWNDGEAVLGAARGQLTQAAAHGAQRIRRRQVL